MRSFVKAVTVLALIGMFAIPLKAFADYSQDFEGLNASPSGVVLSGQDGYYLPSGTSSVDFLVYTYAGNTLGVVQNPAGGSKFIAGTGPGDGTYYARAQRDYAFSAGVWELWYDFCGIYSGSPPGTNNLGSFSMRQAANTVHINLFTWVDPNTPVAINSTYVYYDQYGTQSPIPGTPPGAPWSNLQPNHWYRCRTEVDLNKNLITEVGIRDLSGGNESVYDPTGWYLIGGATPYPLPDAFRFFGGGGGPGNTSCWDNMGILPKGAAQGACCAPDGSCTITTQANCQGQYMGDGTTCDPNPCKPVPVLNKTWGAIKNLYH